MPPSAAAVGVDLGGSYLRITVLNEAGRRIRHLREPAPRLDELFVRFAKTFKRWSIREAPSLTIASRGVWTPAEREALAKRLRPFARKVRAISDIEAAWLGAFQGRSAGVMTVAGTGSIAFGEDADGCRIREGGLGPFLGDEGSAFWIGRSWIRRTKSAAETERFLEGLRESRQPVALIAAVASEVLEADKRRDRDAQAILKEAQAHVAELTLAAVRRLHWQKEIPVSWGGGLLDMEAFRKGWWKALRAAAGSLSSKLVLVTPKQDAVEAAALDALRHV
jgi:glucosamine kinase